MNITPEEKNRRRAERRAEKPGRLLGNFLRDWNKSMGWSREEAASRGRISQGYLCHLLAGDVVMPRPELLQSLAQGWGFNVVKALIASGFSTRKDVEDFVREEKILKDAKSSYDAELQQIVDMLLDMEPEERELEWPIIRAQLHARRMRGMGLARPKTKKVEQTERELLKV